MICPACGYEKWDGRSTHFYGGRTSTGLNCFGRIKGSTSPIHGRAAGSNSSADRDGESEAPSLSEDRRDAGSLVEGSERRARRASKRKPKKVKVAKPKPARYIEEEDGSPVMIAPKPKPTTLDDVVLAFTPAPALVADVILPPEIAKLQAEGKLTTGATLQPKPPLQKKRSPSRSSKAQGRFRLSTNTRDSPDNQSGRPKPSSKSSGIRRDRTASRQARSPKR